MADKIAGYLGKYKNLQPPEENIRNIFIEILEKELKTKILKNHIKILRGSIYVNSASHIKNRVFVKKEVLLCALVERLGSKAPKDIR